MFRRGVHVHTLTTYRAIHRSSYSYIKTVQPTSTLDHAPLALLRNLCVFVVAIRVAISILSFRIDAGDKYLIQFNMHSTWFPFGIRTYCVVAPLSSPLNVLQTNIYIWNPAGATSLGKPILAAFVCRMQNHLRHASMMRTYALEEMPPNFHIHTPETYKYIWFSYDWNEW